MNDLLFSYMPSYRNALSHLGGADAIVMQSTVGEELVQGPNVAARAGFEPAILRTEGTQPYHWATTPHLDQYASLSMKSHEITVANEVEIQKPMRNSNLSKV